MLKPGVIYFTSSRLPLFPLIFPLPPSSSSPLSQPKDSFSPRKGQSTSNNFVAAKCITQFYFSRQCSRFTLQLLVNRESRATTRYTRFLFLPALIFSPPLRRKKWRWFSKRTVPRNPSHALLAISAGLIISNLVRFNTGEKIEELE